MTETKHTPGSYRVIDDELWVDINGEEYRIANMRGIEDDRIANAEFIVRACNAYDDLLAACEQLVSIEMDEGGKRLGRCIYCNSANGHRSNPYCPVAMARAAIAKAKGE